MKLPDLPYRLCDETDNPINQSGGKHVATFGVNGLMLNCLSFVYGFVDRCGSIQQNNYTHLSIIGYDSW